jgi:hypothetical protein
MGGKLGGGGLTACRAVPYDFARVIRRAACGLIDVSPDHKKAVDSHFLDRVTIEKRSHRILLVPVVRSEASNNFVRFFRRIDHEQSVGKSSTVILVDEVAEA